MINLLNIIPLLIYVVIALRFETKLFFLAVFSLQIPLTSFFTFLHYLTSSSPSRETEPSET